MMKRGIVEGRKSIPVSHSCDVVVVGGGPAGITAALASARRNKKVILVERYGYLGGLVTGSYVTYLLGFSNGERELIKGISKEIRRRLKEMGAFRPSNNPGDGFTDAEVFKYLAVIMLEEAGVRMLLHSLAVETIMEDNVGKGIIIENKSGRQGILGNVVIDTTGDGDVAQYAGAEYKQNSNGITLITRFENIDMAKRNRFAKKHPQKMKVLMAKLKKLVGEEGITGTFWGYNSLDVTNLTYIENESRKRVFKRLEFFKQNIPGYESACISLTAPQLGVRQGRRIMGDYVLTESDLVKSRKFKDTICRAGVHLKSKTFEESDPGLEYDIPYRCLLPRGIENIIVAGRCISTTHKAQNSIRCIGPCMATGEAAGVASAMAVENKSSLRNIDIGLLQSILMKAET